MEDGSPWIAIVVLIILISMNGLLAAAEISLVSLKKIRLKQKAESGDSKAKKLLEMKQNPSDFLSTIQIGITLAGLLSGAFAADTLAKPVVKYLYKLGISGAWISFANVFTVIVITIIITYFMLVFGELVPKRLAMENPYKIGKKVILSIYGLSVLTKPLVHLLSISTNSVLHFLGIDSKQDNNPVTEEDILLTMREGREQGTIEESEEYIVKNLFKFTDLFVEDAMVHRTEIKAIPVDASFLDVVRLISETSHGKFPVFENHIDKIVGIVYSKDLVSRYPLDHSNSKFPKVKDMMRSPFFVSESQSLVNIFTEMKRKKSYLAVVVDEYGGTSGIITMTDIIEEIIGNIETPEEKMIQDTGEGGYMIDGRIKIKELSEFLNIKIDSDENNTLSGFIIDSLGFVPNAGQTPEIKVENFIFRVKKMDGPLIRTIYAKENDNS
ncbi:MAG: HlyC/CorC family transporter [Candidatus Atribacteria bacterium]|nr:HlyC/CorC family transporter [Candidatus Atribacteria bacterium]